MDYRLLPQAPQVCHSSTSDMIDMLETKPFAMRMTMLTPFYQERLQDGRNQSGTKRNCNAIIRKTVGNYWKPCLAPVRGRFRSCWKQCSICENLSSSCSRMSLSKTFWVKLLSGACWFNKVCYAYCDIVILLNAKDLHETYWCHWKSSKCEHLSDIHKERVLKCPLEVSKHLDLDCHWCHWVQVCKLKNLKNFMPPRV